MSWLEKIAGKLKISVIMLIILMSVVAVVLITGTVLLVIFWGDIQYDLKVRRLPEGDAIDVTYVFTNEKTQNMLPNSKLLKETLDSDSVELACMGEEPDCEVSFFYQPDGRPLTLTTMVLNEDIGYPVTLSGVNLEFTGYEPYSDVNMGITRGGMLGDSAGVRDKLKMVTDGDKITFAGSEEWLNSQVKEPAEVVGKYFSFDMAEQYAENPGLLSMQADEAEILLIELPFSEDTPPGWYAFQVFMQYETPEGDRFRTEAQTMNVLVPDTVSFYDYFIDDEDDSVDKVVGDQFFISMKPFNGEIFALDVNVSPSTNYTMIMKTGVHEQMDWGAATYWKYNLALGMPVQIHPPYTIGNVYPSNDGWKHVIMMPDYQWGLYNLSTDSTILLDETARFITPVWSPGDSKLAFFHSTEENVIGIFDVVTEEIEEIQLTLTGTIKDMQWMSDQALVLLVQSGKVTNFYRYHPDGDRLEIMHGIAGVDEDRFLITSQGRIVAINDEFGVSIPDMKYIYPLEYGSADVDGWYCEWLPSEFVAFCSSADKVYLVDQVNETTEKILESGSLVGIENLGANGLAVITSDDIVYVFSIFGEEQARFYIEGISQQFAFGLHFTFLEGH